MAQPTAGPSNAQAPDEDLEFLRNPRLVVKISQMFLYLEENVVDEETFENFNDEDQSHVERVRFIQKALLEHDLIPRELNERKKNSDLAKHYQSEATKCLAQKKPFEALYLFNKMVALVDYTSVGSPMNYAFRSSLLSNLDRWEESLEDIELALTSDHLSVEFTERLLQLKDEAIEEVEKQQEISEGSQTPFSYTPTVKENTKRLPKVANFIRLETSKKKGRRVLAKRDIPTGSIVAIARPFSHRLLPIRNYTRCHNCLSRNHLRLIPCGFCTTSMYCGSDCMMEGRRTFHNIECPIVDFLDRALNLDELLILRMTLKAVSCFSTIAELRNFMHNECQSHSDALNPIAKYYTEDQKALHQILRLRTSELVRDGPEVFRRATLTAVLTIMLIRHTKMKDLLQAPKDEEFFIELMMRMAFIADLNTRNLKNLRGDIYAKGVFPLPSLFNHSCAANVDRFAYKDELVLLTCRKISAGEELTTNVG